MTIAKKKRGRPPKPPEERRGANITFRTPGGLRTRLEDVVKVSGRSISEEVVHRLERSFVDEKNHAQALQAEVEMRLQADDELERANARIETLELQQLNIADAIERAISNAFAKAGLPPKKDDAS